MTPQEIKDNAPDGATHYEIDEDGDVFYYSMCEHECCWNEHIDGKIYGDSPYLNESRLLPL